MKITTIALLTGLLSLSSTIYAQNQDLFATAEYSHQSIEFDANVESDFNGGVIGFSTSPRQQYGYWGKFEYATSDKTDSNLYEGTLGINYNILNSGDFYLNGSAGLGYARIESGVTSSNLNFISLPLGVEAGFSLNKNLDLFASVGYKWLFDMTGNEGYFGGGKISTGSSTAQDYDKTLCADGTWFNGSDPSLCSMAGGVIPNPEQKTLCQDRTWSNSSGSGTCSNHGGIFKKEKGGNLTSLKAKYGNSISLGDADAAIYKIGLRFSF